MDAPESRSVQAVDQGEVAEVGTFRLDLESAEALSASDVGYLIAGIKEVKETKRARLS